MNFTHSVTRQPSKAKFTPETCRDVSVSRLTPVMSTDLFLIRADLRSELGSRQTYRVGFVGAAPRSAASHLHPGSLSPASQSTAELQPAKHARARKAKPGKDGCLNRSKSGLRFETNSILSRGEKNPLKE